MHCLTPAAETLLQLIACRTEQKSANDSLVTLGTVLVQLFLLYSVQCSLVWDVILTSFLFLCG